MIGILTGSAQSKRLSRENWELHLPKVHLLRCKLGGSFMAKRQPPVETGDEVVLLITLLCFYIYNNTLAFKVILWQNALKRPLLKMKADIEVQK